MKTNHWLWVLGTLGWLGCGGDSTGDGMRTEPPGSTNARTAAITTVVDDDCNTAARCEQIGSGKNFANREQCVAGRQSFWDDKWSTRECEGKINPDKLRACREAVQNLLCNNLTDELKVYNSTCAVAEVCSGQP